MSETITPAYDPKKIVSGALSGAAAFFQHTGNTTAAGVIAALDGIVQGSDAVNSPSPYEAVAGAILSNIAVTAAAAAPEAMIEASLAALTTAAVLPEAVVVGIGVAATIGVGYFLDHTVGEVAPEVASILLNTSNSLPSFAPGTGAVQADIPVQASLLGIPGSDIINWQRALDLNATGETVVSATGAAAPAGATAQVSVYNPQGALETQSKTYSDGTSQVTYFPPNPDGGPSSLTFDQGGNLLKANFTGVTGTTYRGVLDFDSNNIIHVPTDGRTYYVDLGSPIDHVYIDDATKIHLTVELIDPQLAHETMAPVVEFSNALSEISTATLSTQSPVYRSGITHTVTVVQNNSGSIRGTGSSGTATTAQVVINQYIGAFGNQDIVTYDAVPSNSNLTTNPAIDALYQQLLGRPADTAGDSAWQAILSSPTGSLGAVRVGIATSPEAAADISTLYQNLLGRPADPAGLASYQQAMSQTDGSLTAVRNSIAYSAEAAANIGTLYQQILGRAVDPGGLASFQAAMAQPGGTLLSVRASIANSLEASQAIGTLYQNILGRAADAAGLAHFQQLLAQAGGTLAGVQAMVASSQEAANAVGALYQAVLGRAVDNAGLAHWQSVLSASAGSLAQVQAGIAGSAESAANINNLYQQELGRAGEVGGVAHFQAVLSAPGATISTVRAALAGGAEESNDIQQISQAVLHRPATATELSSDVAQISQGTITVNGLLNKMEFTYNGGGLQIGDLNKPGTTTNYYQGSIFNIDFTGSSGHYVVQGFGPYLTTDLVHVNAASGSIPTFVTSISDTNAGALIGYANGSDLLISGVSSSHLTVSNFLISGHS